MPTVSGLQSQLAQRRMIVWPATQRPVIFPFALFDRHVVDAGDSEAHQAVLIKLPTFIAVAAKPVAAIVVPFVGEADGDTVLSKCPELLDQPVVEFAIPLAPQERPDLSAPLQYLDAIAPATTRCVRRRYVRRIARVPRVFSHAYLLRSRFCGERRKWRPIHFLLLNVHARECQLATLQQGSYAHRQKMRRAQATSCRCSRRAGRPSRLGYHRDAIRRSWL